MVEPIFPEADLLGNLVDIYFRENNDFFPILHKPTFKRAIAEGLHATDLEFGKVVLLVCAIASRWSDDPRVLYPGSSLWHSAGWQWYNQAHALASSQLLKPTLYQVQFFAVSY
jgi:hypothetical protein